MVMNLNVMVGYDVLEVVLNGGLCARHDSEVAEACPSKLANSKGQL